MALASMVNLGKMDLDRYLHQFQRKHRVACLTIVNEALTYTIQRH